MTDNSALHAPTLASQPPQIPFIPRDIISLIAEYLDRQSLLTLDRLCQAYRGIANDYIWETLELWLPTSHGLHSAISPFADRGYGTQGRRAQRWLDNELEEAERRYRADLCTLLQTVQERADGRHWGKVKELFLGVRPGAISLMLEILRSSTHLKTLELFRQEWHSYRDHLRPTAAETLDVQLITSGLHLPSLTKLTITGYTLYFAETIYLLVNMAPNLTILDATLNLCSSRQVKGASPPRFPPLTGPTKLRTLIFEFGGHERFNNSAELEVMLQEQNLMVGIVLDLSAQSPELERLDLHYFGSSSHLKRKLILGINKHPSLQKLSCRVDMAELRAMISEEEITFSSLRELRLDPAMCLDVFSYLPPLPFIETILLHQPPPPRDKTLPTVSAPTSVQSMVHPFASHLRDCPRLGVLHTLWSGNKGGPHGFIHSYRHDDAEFLYAHLLLDVVEVSDRPSPPRAADHFCHELVIEYTARDGSLRDRTYVRLPEPVWISYTDLDGLVVPLDILETMCRVEGLSEEEWARRGVEVGKDAWKVVMDYSEMVDE